MFEPAADASLPEMERELLEFWKRREPDAEIGRGLARGGPYRALRHLGYVELAMMDAGLPLALNQPYLLALAPIALLVRRARLETGLWRQAYP